jgi:branched-chain amino acid transport system permease protein
MADAARTGRVVGLLQAIHPAPSTTSAAALALLALCPLVVSEYFASDVVARAMVLAILALSLELAWGYAGILCLGQSAFFGLGAYAVAILSLRWSSPWAMPVGIVLGVLIPSLLAAVVGWFIFFGASSTLYVAIVTLALPVLLSAIDLRISGLTGGLTGLSGVPAFPWDSAAASYYLLLAVLTGIVTALLRLVKSDFGRLLVAVRDNEQRARFLGYRTPAVRLVAFVVAAVLAGFAGALYAPFNGFVSYDLLGLTLSTSAIVWVAIGGRGTVAGPLLGALIINMLEPALNRMFPGYWQLILGLLFIIVILVFPRGFYGLISGFAQPANAVRIAEIAPVQPIEDGLAISASDVRLTLGSLAVLQGINLKIATGVLHSLIGPNGAGKSTLVDVMTGLIPPTGGEVTVDGRPIAAGQPDLVARRRILRTFQASNVFETLPVADNLVLARNGGRWPSPLRRTAVLSLPPQAVRILELSGLGGRVKDRAGALGHGERKWLELCMIIAAEPAIIFLDEPTAGLSPADRARAGEVLAGLVQQRRIGMLVIEHDLEFVKSIAERLTVLSGGRVLADGETGAVINDPRVRQIYLGQRTEGAEPRIG